MHVPSLNTWDQFVWPWAVAMPRATMEVEQYGYCRSQAVDLRPIMPATQFRVTDQVGTYLCAVWALVFEGSVLAYNPTRDKVEWVPTRGIANDLSWVEEKSAVALANYMPRISKEAAHIARLRAHHLMSWPNDSSSQEEKENEQEEEEEDEQEEEEEHVEVEEQGEAGPELAVWGSSKVKRSKRPNHRDDDDRGSGGRSWTRRNVLPLMTHGQTPTPQQVVTARYICPCRSQGH